jgi:hypothetical protein
VTSPRPPVSLPWAKDGYPQVSQTNENHVSLTRCGPSVAEAILSTADKLDADIIVLGSHGLGGVGSLLLGSVSHRVLQHADRPVPVIPSAEVAARRHKDRESEAATA